MKPTFPLVQSTFDDVLELFNISEKCFLVVRADTMLENIVGKRCPDLVGFDEPHNWLKNRTKVSNSPTFPRFRRIRIAATVVNDSMRCPSAYPCQIVSTAKTRVFHGTNAPVRQTSACKDETIGAGLENAIPFRRPL